jgi:hypothetical protein
MENKPDVIRVPVTPEDRALLSFAAKSLGMPLATWIRMEAIKAARQQLSARGG